MRWRGGGGDTNPISQSKFFPNLISTPRIHENPSNIKTGSFLFSSVLFYNGGCYDFPKIPLKCPED